MLPGAHLAVLLRLPAKLWGVMLGHSHEHLAGRSRRRCCGDAQHGAVPLGNLPGGDSAVAADVAPHSEKASLPAEHPCPWLCTPARRRAQSLCPGQAQRQLVTCSTGRLCRQGQSRLQSHWCSPAACAGQRQVYAACLCPFPVAVPMVCGLTGSCSAHHSRRCGGWARGRTRRSPAQLLEAEMPAGEGPCSSGRSRSPAPGNSVCTHIPGLQ